MDMKSTREHKRMGRGMLLAGLILLAGCAGANRSADRSSEDFVEIQNPALTMSPNAPATIWVPRSSVEQGIPRGRDLARQGYQALVHPAQDKGAPAEAGRQPAPAAPAQPQAAAPAAPAVQAAQAVPAAAPQAPAAAPPAPVGFYDTSGKAAALVPRFGLVVAQEGDRIYFNLGKEDGVARGQKLKLYRGGTVVKGLGLAPGQTVGTLEVQGLVGSNGAWGVMREGGTPRVNDLVGVE